MEPTESPNEPKPNSYEQPVLDALRHVWWAGLGLVAVAGEQSSQVLTALVEKGKQMEPAVVEHGKKATHEVSETVGDLGEKLKDLAAKVGRSAGAAEAAWDERVAAALGRMGFPSKGELESLSAKIDALTAKLEQMREQGG